MPEVLWLRPHCSKWDIFLAELVQRNHDFVLWIGAEMFKPANGRWYFHTVRALEQQRITNTETFVVDGRNAGNENEPAILDQERVGDGEESSFHHCPL